jgi:hypothetical protein
MLDCICRSELAPEARDENVQTGGILAQPDALAGQVTVNPSSGMCIGECFPDERGDVQCVARAHVTSTQIVLQRNLGERELRHIAERDTLYRPRHDPADQMEFLATDVRKPPRILQLPNLPDSARHLTDVIRGLERSYSWPMMMSCGFELPLVVDTTTTSLGEIM